MTRPRIADLACCAGGAAMGYHRAGFEVVGVDINPQPRYPFLFVRADGIEDSSIVLCGGMFGLRTYRHRRFEYGGGLTLAAPEHPRHVARTATKQRRQRWAEGWHVSITGDVGTYVGPEAMGIDWMNGTELCEAVPPAYTEFIGRQLIEALSTEGRAA